MKIDTARNLETNISSAVQFKFSENASKLFAMLGSYLYSKKEECVLHELSANAIDAHKMVGKEHEPIHVILPTRLDSQLRIRDFGPGLSEENVYRFLTTYGESNKQESNDFIGGWGIGSKSPASVSDTWKIISHHEGTMTEYLVFINGDGLPSLTKIRAIPTDETGLEVSIPIPDDRIQAWKTVIPSVYAFYPVSPKVSNAEYYGVKKRVPSSKTGDNWWIEHGSNAVANVIASNRCYACDADKLMKEMVDARAKAMLKLPLFLEMSVGDVDLSISREQMQFTNKTIAAVEARLIEVYEFYKGKFDAVVANHTDELDYRVQVINFMRTLFNQSHHGFRNLPFMSSFVGGKYGITQVDDLIKFKFGIVGMNETGLAGMNVRVTNGKVVKTVTPSFNCWRDFAIIADAEYDKTIGRTYDIRIQIDKLSRMEFFLADCKDACARVRHNMGNNTRFAVVFDTMTGVPALIASRVTKASTLSPKPRAARGSGVSRTKTADDVYIMDGGRFLRVDGNVLLAVDATGKMTNKLAYVVTDTFASTGSFSYNTMIDTLIRDGYRIIGVKELADVPAGVRPVIDEFDSVVRSVVASKELATEVDRMIRNEIRGSAFFSLLAVPAIKTKTDSLWNAFTALYNDRIVDAVAKRFDNSRHYPVYDSAVALCKSLESADSKRVVKVNLDSLDVIRKDLTEIQEAYKMLHYLRTDLSNDSGFNGVAIQFLELAGV